MASYNVAVDDAYNRILYFNWEPVGAEIADEYGLSERTVGKVKRLLKARFADEGMVWGYDPDENRFVLAPSNLDGVQRRILNYAIEHASSSANSIGHQIAGALSSGSITPGSAVEAQQAISRGAHTVASAAAKLAWMDVEAQSNYALAGEGKAG